MKVLVVEPWLAGSHRAWAEGYARSSTHEVRIVGLPGEQWRWRLEGSSLPLASSIREHIVGGYLPDLLLVSGLTDVAQLRGHLGRVLPPELPVVVYQHESQLLYPSESKSESESVSKPGRTRASFGRTPALINWSSWLVADAVFFNSDFHRAAVVEQLPAFLNSLPDRSHHPALVDTIARFDVLPVGVDLSWCAKPNIETRRPSSKQPWPVILWPHRWEADKDPLAFGRALDRLVDAGLDHRLVLAGELPTVASDLRDAATARHKERVLAAGPFETDQYRQHVLGADIVVSCARHEFFGVAIVEAVAAGCVPVVPNALAYPETLGPDAGAYQPGAFGAALERAVRAWHDEAAFDGRPQMFARQHGWDQRAQEYDQRLAALVTCRQ